VTSDFALQLGALFLAAFASATLLPLPSEAALIAFLRLNPQAVLSSIVVASAGNVLGSMTSYAIGRVLHRKQFARIDDHVSPASLARARRWGAAVLLLAWLPIVGDALCVAAGWLRMNWLVSFIMIAIGKIARYWVVAYAFFS
jgi:membrane protein YqaA with SNARE-associated domain